MRVATGLFLALCTVVAATPAFDDSILYVLSDAPPLTQKHRHSRNAPLVSSLVRHLGPYGRLPASENGDSPVWENRNGISTSTLRFTPSIGWRITPANQSAQDKASFLRINANDSHPALLPEDSTWDVALPIATKKLKNLVALEPGERRQQLADWKEEMAVSKKTRISWGKRNLTILLGDAGRKRWIRRVQELQEVRAQGAPSIVLGAPKSGYVLPPHLKHVRRFFQQWTQRPEAYAALQTALQDPSGVGAEAAAALADQPRALFSRNVYWNEDESLCLHFSSGTWLISTKQMCGQTDGLLQIFDDAILPENISPLARWVPATEDDDDWMQEQSKQMFAFSAINDEPLATDATTGHSSSVWPDGLSSLSALRAFAFALLVIYATRLFRGQAARSPSLAAGNTASPGQQKQQKHTHPRKARDPPYAAKPARDVGPFTKVSLLGAKGGAQQALRRNPRAGSTSPSISPSISHTSENERNESETPQVPMRASADEDAVDAAVDSAPPVTPSMPPPPDLEPTPASPPTPDSQQMRALKAQLEAEKANTQRLQERLQAAETSRSPSPPGEGRSHEVVPTVTAAENRCGIDEDRLCVVCLDHPKSHLFTGCGHKCVCEDCAALIEGSKDGSKSQCPVCRRPSQAIVRVFE